MVRISLITLLLIIITASGISAQNNLVPNYSFEEGQNGGYPRGNIYYSMEGTYCRLNNDISQWKEAQRNPSGCWCTEPPLALASACGSPDWESINNPFPGSTFLYKDRISGYSSERFMCLGGSDDDNSDEGVYVALNQTLIKGKLYEFRIKYGAVPQMGAMTTDKLKLDICVSEWGEHWNSASSKKTVIPGIISSTLAPNFEFYKYYIHSVKFAALQDNLNYLVIMADKGYFFIDDVELFEYCPEEMLIENKTYSGFGTVMEEATLIKAGYDVGAPTPNGNVVVKSGTKAIFKAEEVIIEPGFVVETGAEWETKLAPCGYEDWPVPENKIINTCISNKIPTIIPLGGNYNNAYSYYWTATPPEAINYLMNQNADNTAAIIQPGQLSGNGTIVYKLEVKDNNGMLISSTETTVNFFDHIEVLWYNNSVNCTSSNNYFTITVVGAEYYDLEIRKNSGSDVLYLVNDVPITSNTFTAWDCNNSPSGLILTSGYEFFFRFWNHCGDELKKSYPVSINNKKTNDSNNEDVINTIATNNTFTNQIINFELFDITGRRILKKENVYLSKYDLLLKTLQLQDGIYFLVSKIGDNLQFQKIIIKSDE